MLPPDRNQPLLYCYYRAARRPTVLPPLLTLTLRLEVLALALPPAVFLLADFDDAALPVGMNLPNVPSALRSILYVTPRRVIVALPNFLAIAITPMKSLNIASNGVMRGLCADVAAGLSRKPGSSAP
jgi:hypothetical protein